MQSVIPLLIRSPPKVVSILYKKQTPSGKDGVCLVLKIIKLNTRERRNSGRVTGMDDNTLSCDVMKAMFAVEQSNELHQIHVAKAFKRYIDQLVEESIRKAEQQFVHSGTLILRILRIEF